MKICNMQLEFKNDTSKAFDNKIHLSTTSSVLYVLLITRPKKFIETFAKCPKKTNKKVKFR